MNTSLRHLPPFPAFARTLATSALPPRFGSLVRLLALLVFIAAFAAPHAGAQPGTVVSYQKISSTMGGFEGAPLDDGDFFGSALAAHSDAEGVPSLVVGALADDDGGTDRGAVWVLPLTPNGMVEGRAKISDAVGGFDGALSDGDFFGRSVVDIGDLDGDGASDLAVGAESDDDGGVNRGAVWVLFTGPGGPSGQVASHQKISDTEGGFNGALSNGDFFGSAVATLGDLDGDGVTDLAVGASLDNDGAQDAGAAWILFLNADGTVKDHQKISSAEGGFEGALEAFEFFGASLTPLGDLDGDGIIDLAVGAPSDNGDGVNRGAVHVLFLNADGTVKDYQKISDTEGGFSGSLTNNDQFGLSVASISDLDGDGVRDLAVGAYQDDDGGANRGAVWILFLNTDGTVKGHQKISSTEGGFDGALDNDDEFGFSLAALSTLGDDGTAYLAVGAIRDDDGGTNRGAVWVLALERVPTTAEEPSATSGAVVLHVPFPNPIAAGTTVGYHLPQSVHVTLAVHDVLGREVARLVDEIRPAGEHAARWDGRNVNGQRLAAGVYLVRLHAGGVARSQKIVLLR